MCAPRATDRDLESVSASFSVNAWTCARLSTDRDLESAFHQETGECLDMSSSGNRP